MQNQETKVFVTHKSFTRINNSTSGNPRYVMHFLGLLTEGEKDVSITELYQIALKRSRTWQGRKYHTKSYGGGIAFEHHNIYDLCEKINKYMTNVFEIEMRELVGFDENEVMVRMEENLTKEEMEQYKSDGRRIVEVDGNTFEILTAEMIEA